VVEDGITKKVWLEDRQSMQLKIDAIKEAGCGGVGAWKLGQEPNDIWEIVNINQ
jgi:spore germination protein YaaH